MRATLLFLCLAACLAAPCAESSPFPVDRLLASLRITTAPDVPKMNVSEEEYENKFQEYERLINKRSVAGDSISFRYFKLAGQKPRSTVQFNWAKNISTEKLEGSRIRVFVQGEKGAEIEVHRVGNLKEIRTLDELPRWVEFDGSDDWWNVKLVCKKCLVSRATLYVLTRKEGARSRRNSEQIGRTDCKRGPKGHRCCRHPMQVIFSELPGYEFILQPFSFDAGFCKGSCPHRYNPANHHATLQSLIWRLKKGDAPRPCCAPSQLEPLQIIHLDEHDPTKLKVATWSNIKVTECACF